MKFVVDSSIVFFFDELVPATSRTIFVKTTIMNEFHFIDRACCEDRSGSIKKKRKRVRRKERHEIRNPLQTQNQFGPSSI